MVKRQPTSSARRAMPSCAGKPACSFGAGRRCTPHSSDLQVQSFSVASASSLTVASSRMVPRDNVRPRMRPRWLSIIMLLPIDGADGEEDMESVDPRRILRSHVDRSGGSVYKARTTTRRDRQPKMWATFRSSGRADTLLRAIINARLAGDDARWCWTRTTRCMLWLQRTNGSTGWTLPTYREVSKDLEHPDDLVER
jgi:hypothetical protein